MSLFAPTNIIPSSLSGVGEGTVDATEPLIVSWKVNGTSPLMQYQIVIYKNDSQSTQVYTTGIVPLQEPFYGTDENGNAVTFTATAIPVGTLQNGNEYKLVITQWWNTSSSVTQPSASPFITRSMPTCSILNAVNTLSVRDYVFNGTYIQEQGDSLNRVRWILSDENDNILSDTGWINTEQLMFAYDGFFNDSSYSLSLNIETQNGQTASAGIDFSVSYPVGTANGSLMVCGDKEESAINVSWEGQATIDGTPDGNVDVRNMEAIISENSSITWDRVNTIPMAFQAPYTTLWLGTVYSNAEQAVAEAQSAGGLNTVLYFGGGKATLKQNGTQIAQITGIPQTINRFGFAVTPTALYIATYAYPNGLNPNTSLTPKTSLYPKSGDATVTMYQATLNRISVQTSINALVLHGAQKCEYFCVQEGAMTEESIQALLNSGTQPAWDGNTYFLATFDNGTLNGGNRDTKGYAVYRLEAGETVLKHIADFPLSTVSFKDYGAKSQKVYTYYQFNIGENTYTTAPLISAPAAFMMPRWSVLECQKDGSGIYHVLRTYNFGLNISNTSISNNNAPTLQKTFTHYPLRQMTASLYRSGTLQAMIGRNMDGMYYDSTDMADAIYSLSVSENPKFLKSPKGELWQIETAKEIQMTVNAASALQPYTVSLPWAEVADASTASIVG